MGRLIEIRASQGSIFVESSEVRRSRVNQAVVTEVIGNNLEKLLAVINPFCEAFVKNVKSLGENKPSSTSVEFGLSFTGEGNIFFVKATGEASIKVTFNWT